MIGESIPEEVKRSGVGWAVVEPDEHNNAESPECACRCREYLKIPDW